MRCGTPRMAFHQVPNVLNAFLKTLGLHLTFREFQQSALFQNYGKKLVVYKMSLYFIFVASGSSNCLLFLETLVPHHQVFYFCQKTEKIKVQTACKSDLKSTLNCILGTDAKIFYHYHTERNRVLMDIKVYQVSQQV